MNKFKPGDTVKVTKFGQFNHKTMEQQFKSLTIFEFQSKFPDDRSCLAYLAELKWADGYVCQKCGNTKYCAAGKEFSRTALGI